MRTSPLIKRLQLGDGVGNIRAFMKKIAIMLVAMLAATTADLTDMVNVGNAAQLAGKRFFKIPPRQAGVRNDILHICSPGKGGLA